MIVAVSRVASTFMCKQGANFFPFFHKSKESNQIISSKKVLSWLCSTFYLLENKNSIYLIIQKWNR